MAIARVKPAAEWHALGELSRLIQSGSVSRGIWAEIGPLTVCQLFGAHAQKEAGLGPKGLTSRGWALRNILSKHEIPFLQESFCATATVLRVSLYIIVARAVAVRLQRL